MCRIKLIGLAIVALGLIIMSMGQSFAQEDSLPEAIPEALPTDNAAKIRPLTVSTGLIDSTVITGTLIDSTELSIKTAFGQASIPLSEVAGIRFPAGEEPSTTVVMLNGDSITGATDLKFATVETTWGSAKINGESIATMLFVPGLRWDAVDSLGGKRWQLVEATAPRNANLSVGNLPSNAQPRSTVQQAGGTRLIPNTRVVPGAVTPGTQGRPPVFGR